MAWVGFPITAASADLNAYEKLIQLWKATRERALAAGQFWWPDQSTPYGQGVVPAGITATSFTDTNANDGDGWGVDGYANPWSKVTEDNRIVGLTSWDLVIDDCDYRKVVRTTVTSWTATTVNFESIADCVTAGYIPSLASLVGKRYYFIRGDYGVTWAERMLEFPNDYEHASGTVREYHDDPENPGTVTNPTATTLKDDTRRWTVDEHAGRDLLVYGAADNLLKRVTLTGNTRDTLTFPTQSWTPKVGSAYVVVAAGGVATPGKGKVYPFTYYRGARDTVQGHAPAPTGGSYVDSTEIPALDVTHGDTQFPSGCNPVAEFTAIDTDYITDLSPSPEQLACGYPSEKFFAPDLYKTLRGLQVACQQLAPNFAEKIDYEGVPGMPPLVDALLFKAAGVGLSFTTTITSFDEDEGGVYIPSQAFPYYPIQVYYAVLDQYGELARWGTATADSSTHLDGAAVLEADIGRTIVVSTGWVRRVPREVQRMFYPKTCFLPDVMGDPIPGAIDPPGVDDFAETGCAGVGRWETRGVSSKYWAQGVYGPADGDDFVEGELARYVGDNWNEEIDATADALIPYADHFYTGRFPREVQALIRQQRRGTPTAATSTSLTDAGQDWWQNCWYEGAAGPVSHTESGTATGGSTTSLTDSSKAATDPETEPNCWWKAARFTDFAGPYVGFTVEVLMSGASFSDPDAVIEKRLITSGSAAGVLGWDVALSASASGKPYRIREPAYELNRWKGRTVYFTLTDGTPGSAEILGNDDTTLFFAAVTGTIDVTRRYRIHEHETGGVWKRSGGTWVKPTGDDALRTFVTGPLPFVEYQPGNLPTYVTRYGRTLPRDNVTSVLNQLYNAMRALAWIRKTPVWDNPDEVVNSRGGDTGDDDSFDTWNELWVTGNDLTFPFPFHTSSVTELYEANPGTFNGGGLTPSVVVFGANMNPDAQSKGGSAVRQTNLSRVNIGEVSCPIPSQAEWWVFSTITAADPDEGAVCVHTDTRGNEWRVSEFIGGAVDGVLFRQLHKWYTEPAPSTDLERLSGFLGDWEAMPGVPNDPASGAGACHADAEDYYSEVTAGWYAQRVYCLLKYDVTGGFEFP